MGLLIASAIYMAAINLAAFVLYGWDKSRARRGGRRIPERRLLLLALLGGALGAFVGMRVFHHKTRKRKFTWAVTPLMVVQMLVFAAFVAFNLYAANYYHATDEARAALESTAEVAVSRRDDGYLFDGPGSRDVLVFYPGAKVEVEAYAPLMREVASRGVDCVLVRMPYNLAFLGQKRADAVVQGGAYERVYLGGHSLGGAMAARYAAEHADSLAGIVLLASYAPDDLSQSGLVGLSMYGTHDGVLNRNAYESNRSHLPQGTQELLLEGGNHAQFGSYGPQEGDGEAAISASEQQSQAAAAIAALAQVA